MNKLKWRYIFLSNSGQALLIIVAVVAIALSVGISVATRAIINLRNTSNQVASQQALSAAEAGIEQAIIKNLQPGERINETSIGYNLASGATENTSQATYETNVSSIIPSTNAVLLNGGAEIEQHDPIYVWTVPYSEEFPNNGNWNGNLRIFWGDTLVSSAVSSTDHCVNSALEIAVIWGSNKYNAKLTRYVFDPCSDRRSYNRFSAPDSYTQQSVPTTIGNVSLQYNKVINLTSSGTPSITEPVLLVRINPIYTGTRIAVSGNPDLVSQGKNIESTGKTAEKTVRKINVFEGYPEIPPEFFPFTLFQP